MSFSENRNCFNPSLISSALIGLTHRFVLILECETAAGISTSVHPRFGVGGPRATQDPRNVLVSDLVDVAQSQVNLPPGWEQIHQYIYVVQLNTDEHGWQYRSDWPRGPLRPNDEPWLSNHVSDCGVRRRLWMTTVVKKDEVLAAKQRVAATLRQRRRGAILQGVLLHVEQVEVDVEGGGGGEGSDSVNNRWERRNCLLTDDKIEVYDDDAKSIAEIQIGLCSVEMLSPSQCPGRSFAFRLRQPNGTTVALFEGDTHEMRRRWVVAITYQTSITRPSIDFPPFPYGPPMSHQIDARTIVCGELQKRGQRGINWKNRFFKLTPGDLLYYERDSLKGAFSIDGALVKADERSLEFTLLTAAGVSVVMRADSSQNKASWVQAIEALLKEQEPVVAKPEDACIIVATAAGVLAQDTPASLEVERWWDALVYESTSRVIDNAKSPRSQMIGGFVIGNNSNSINNEAADPVDATKADDDDAIGDDGEEVEEEEEEEEDEFVEGKIGSVTGDNANCEDVAGGDEDEDYSVTVTDSPSGSLNASTASLAAAAEAAAAAAVVTTAMESITINHGQGSDAEPAVGSSSAEKAAAAGAETETSQADDDDGGDVSGQGGIVTKQTNKTDTDTETTSETKPSTTTPFKMVLRPVKERPERPERPHQLTKPPEDTPAEGAAKDDAEESFGVIRKVLVGEKKISCGISSKVQTWEKFIEEQKRHQTLTAAAAALKSSTPRRSLGSGLLSPGARVKSSPVSGSGSGKGDDNGEGGESIDSTNEKNC